MAWLFIVMASLVPKRVVDAVERVVREASRLLRDAAAPLSDDAAAFVLREIVNAELLTRVVTGIFAVVTSDTTSFVPSDVDAFYQPILDFIKLVVGDTSRERRDYFFVVGDTPSQTGRAFLTRVYSEWDQTTTDAQALLRFAATSNEHPHIKDALLSADSASARLGVVFFVTYPLTLTTTSKKQADEYRTLWLEYTRHTFASMLILIRDKIEGELSRTVHILTCGTRAKDFYGAVRYRINERDVLDSVSSVGKTHFRVIAYAASSPAVTHSPPNDPLFARLFWRCLDRVIKQRRSSANDI